MADAPARILVVDDDAAVRALLRDCFALEGYEVLEAENGQGLRTSLAGGQIQLVTLDLNLGGEDGLALAREIRAEQNVPIVMITGKGDTIDRIVFAPSGFVHYLRAGDELVTELLPGFSLDLEAFFREEGV